MPAVDHFPSTHGTWIGGQLSSAFDVSGPDSAAARESLRKHLMERYYEPLCIYVQSRPLVALGDPADIVGDFFARDFDAAELLRRWRESGMPLRRWMMNAMALHCKGLIRDAGRAARRRDDEADINDISGGDAQAERAFDRAWALSVASRAFEIAQGDADSRGRSQDAMAFRLHAIEGLSHAAIARQLRITESQSSNACRRVSGRMREAIGDLLRQDGVQPDQLEQAVSEVLALVREAGA